MSWSCCSGRVALHVQSTPGQAVLSSALKHRASAASQALPPSTSCSLQHRPSDQQPHGRHRHRPRPSCLNDNRQHGHLSGLGSRRGSLTPAARSPVHDACGQAYSRTQGRGYATQAEDRTIKGPTYMEIFAGIGGFGVAPTKLGYTCVYANENNRYCVEAYEKNHCRGRPGISRVDSRNIESVTLCVGRPSCELPRATLLLGGFPCPSFSNQGNKEGLSSRKHGHLLYEAIKLLIHLQVPLVVLENVSTFATNKRFGGIEEAQKEFEAAGYYMSFGLYKAVDFNLAQNRQRCFLVAVRKDLASGPFTFTKPPGCRQDLALTDFLDPPSPLKDLSQYTLSNGVLVPNRIINGKRAEVVWSPVTPEQMTGPTGLKKVGIWGNQGQERSYKSGNTVYHHSGLASCILTGAGDWYQVPGPDGAEDIIRRLSLREKLRLQGLPENLELSASLEQARKQVGNSVPPPMVERIVRDLQDQFPHIHTSDIHTTTEVWPQVRARKRTPEEKRIISKQLNNLSSRKSKGRARHQVQRALREEDGVLKTSDSEGGAETGHATGTGESLATRTKSLEDLGEQIKSLANILAALRKSYKLLAETKSGRK